MVKFPGVTVNPGRFSVAGKKDEFWVFGHKSLKAPRQTGLFKHEVLHQAQHRGPKGVMVLCAFNRCHPRNTGAANAICAFDHRYIAASALQVIGGNQAIDTCASDQNFRFTYCLKNTREPCQSESASNANKGAGYN